MVSFVFILFVFICITAFIMLSAQLASIFLRLRMRLVRHRLNRIIRQLDGMTYVKTIKRVFSKEDPYGEENWEA